MVDTRWYWFLGAVAIVGLVLYIIGADLYSKNDKKKKTGEDLMIAGAVAFFVGILGIFWLTVHNKSSLSTPSYDPLGYGGEGGGNISFRL